MEEDALTFPHLQAVLEEYGKEVSEKYIANLEWNGHPTMENSLVKSVRSIVSVDGNTYSVSLSLKEYWKYVEWDTRPHFPPPSAIKRWIEVKPIIPETRNGITPTNDQLAFLIGRKIARDGTQGTHSLRDAVTSLEEEWMARINEAITQDVDDMAVKIIYEYMLSDKPKVTIQ